MTYPSPLTKGHAPAPPVADGSPPTSMSLAALFELIEAAMPDALSPADIEEVKGALAPLSRFDAERLVDQASTSERTHTHAYSHTHIHTHTHTDTHPLCGPRS